MCSIRQECVVDAWQMVTWLHMGAVAVLCKLLGTRALQLL